MRKITIFIILLITVSINSQNQRNTDISITSQTWEYVGGTGNTSGSMGANYHSSNSNSFTFDNNDYPYLGFMQEVKMFDGQNWVNAIDNYYIKYQAINYYENSLHFIGLRPDSPEFSDLSRSTDGIGVGVSLDRLPIYSRTYNDERHLQFVFNNNNIPYFIYRNVNRKLSIAYLTSRGWITIAKGISTGISYNERLIFKNNIPYILYKDSGVNNKLIVKKYNGTSWTNIGNTNVFDSTFKNDINTNGNKLYIAFNDTNNNNKLSVKKYDGNNWVYVGTPGFTDFNISEGASLFVENNDVYVLYNSRPASDHSDDGFANVMKFNGSIWNPVGNSDFSLGSIIPNQNYGIKKINNKLYIAFQEKYCVNICANRPVVMSFDLNDYKIKKNLPINNLINIYPNPTNGTLNIKLKDDIKIKDITILNSFGVKILKFNNIPPTIFTSGLKQGIYNIKFNTSKGVIYKKLIKN